MDGRPSRGAVVSDYQHWNRIPVCGPAYGSPDVRGAVCASIRGASMTNDELIEFVIAATEAAAEYLNLPTQARDHANAQIAWSASCGVSQPAEERAATLIASILRFHLDAHAAAREGFAQLREALRNLHDPLEAERHALAALVWFQRAREVAQ